MDYGQEKGFQDGDSCRRTGAHSSGRFCLLATLLTVSLGISLLALVLATSANLQVRGRGEEKADWIEEPKQARDIPNIDTMKLQKNPVGQEAVHEVGGDTEQHSVEERSSTAGRGESLDALCNSDISPNTTEKPSAHIVPAGGSNCRIEPPQRKREVVISKGWHCGNPNALVRLGHVQGGMNFNRTTGYLTLPVDGIYYIYSQVQFSSTSAASIYMSYGTLVYTPGHPELKTVAGPRRYLESYGRPYAGSMVKATFNHGGLIHLPAGAQVGIAAHYDTRGDSLGFSGAPEDSFMGAFLVNEVPFQ